MTLSRYYKIIRKQFGVEPDVFYDLVFETDAWKVIEKYDPDLENYKKGDTKYNMFRILSMEWIRYNEDLVRFKLL